MWKCKVSLAIAMSMMRALVVVLTVVVLSEAQDPTYPPPGAQYIFPKLGCPVLEEPLDCFAGSTTCIAPDNTNIYKVVRARSWWHCGKLHTFFLINLINLISCRVTLQLTSD